MSSSTLRALRTAALALCSGVAVLSAAAQPSTPFVSQPQVQGTAYFVFAEPGAPTMEVIFLGNGTRNGIYKLQAGTSLVEAIALAGGTARSDSSRTAVSTAFIRVLREVDGTVRLVYEATPEALVLDRAAHPELQDGDAVVTVVEYEEVDPPFTLREGLDVASRVASVVSVVLILITRF